jgi:hypothetical protein
MTPANPKRAVVVLNDTPFRRRRRRRAEEVRMGGGSLVVLASTATGRRTMRRCPRHAGRLVDRPVAAAACPGSSTAAITCLKSSRAQRRLFKRARLPVSRVDRHAGGRVLARSTMARPRLRNRKRASGG